MTADKQGPEKEGSGGQDETAAPPPDLRLRGEPPRVTRLSPKVLIGLASVTALSIGAVVGYGLQRAHRAIEHSPSLGIENRPAADALARLPKDYADASPQTPRLGPPLPGDLGKPMLAAGVASPEAGTPSPTPPPDPQAQHLAQETDSARTSRLFSQGFEAAPVSPLASGGAGAAAADAPAPAPGASVQAPQDHKLAFLAGGAATPVVSSERLLAAASPFVVQAGAVISAALLTGIRSDLPGMVTAEVTEPVYDSPTGRYLLIPQGARLIGQYDSSISFGQSRALLVWTRLVMPDGASIVLDRLPAADAQGYAGLQDRVDFHWDAVFKAAALSTVLGVGAEAGTSDRENNLVQALRMGASDSLDQAGQQIVQRQLNVQPTLTIRPGYPVRVMVTRDLVLAPYGPEAAR